MVSKWMLHFHSIVFIINIAGLASWGTNEKLLIPPRWHRYRRPSIQQYQASVWPRGCPPPLLPFSFITATQHPSHRNATHGLPLYCFQLDQALDEPIRPIDGVVTIFISFLITNAGNGLTAERYFIRTGSLMTLIFDCIVNNSVCFGTCMILLSWHGCKCGSSTSRLTSRICRGAANGTYSSRHAHCDSRSSGTTGLAGRIRRGTAFRNFDKHGNENQSWNEILVDRGCPNIVKKHVLKAIPKKSYGCNCRNARDERFFFVVG